MTPDEVERNNRSWWDKHSPDYPFHATTALSVDGSDFPPGRTPYGRFIYCPLPATDATAWGFQTQAGLDRFLADVKAGTLPVKSAIGLPPPPAPRAAPAPAPAAPAVVEDDFDLLGLEDPQGQPEPEPDDFSILDDEDDFDILGDEPAETYPGSGVEAEVEEDDEDGWRE